MEKALSHQLLLICNTEFNLEKVKSLVKKGADINYIINGMTPLLAVINHIVCNYKAKSNKPEITEEYYKDYYKLFLWVLRNGHKHINKSNYSQIRIFNFLLEYGDYIMIREAYIYVDKPYLELTPSIIENLNSQKKYDILNFLYKCFNLESSLSSSTSENVS